MYVNIVYLLINSPHTCIYYALCNHAALVQFSPATYTVTEGVDGFAVLLLTRSGPIDGSSVVTVTTQQGTASGECKQYLLTLRTCKSFRSHFASTKLCLFM